ncbi:MAG: hypothetical protein AAFY48_10020, partial [Bacteroidota bacterium]
YTFFLCTIAVAGMFFTSCENEDDDRPESIRGTRYCELLFINLEGNQLIADTWGTQGLNDCPGDCFESIDTTQLKAETGALAILKNGPRQVMIDDGDTVNPGDTTAVFDCIEMSPLSFLILDPDNSGPYIESIAEQNKTFTWWEGTEVYELISPDGEVYVMQSMSMQYDTELQIEDLPGLEARLELPEGWTYQARTLSEDLTIKVEGTGIKLSDDLNNVYAKM